MQNVPVLDTTLVTTACAGAALTATTPKASKNTTLDRIWVPLCGYPPFLGVCRVLRGILPRGGVPLQGLLTTFSSPFESLLSMARGRVLGAHGRVPLGAQRAVKRVAAAEAGP